MILKVHFNSKQSLSVPIRCALIFSPHLPNFKHHFLQEALANLSRLGSRPLVIILPARLCSITLLQVVLELSI